MEEDEEEKGHHGVGSNVEIHSPAARAAKDVDTASLADSPRHDTHASYEQLELADTVHVLQLIRTHEIHMSEYHTTSPLTHLSWEDMQPVDARVPSNWRIRAHMSCVGCGGKLCPDALFRERYGLPDPPVSESMQAVHHLLCGLCQRLMTPTQVEEVLQFAAPSNTHLPRGVLDTEDITARLHDVALSDAPARLVPPTCEARTTTWSRLFRWVSSIAESEA
jgi:hypothetical protein